MQPIQIVQIAAGPMANFSYLIADTARKTAAYIDPGWEAAKVAGPNGVAAKNGWVIEKILLTHTHFDHIQDLAAAWELTKAPIFVHALEVGAVSELGGAVSELGGAAHAIVTPGAGGEDETIRIGDVAVKCLHTPGHTPGMICFYAAPHLITGDMLFVDGCGRVDLPGSDPDAMFSSLQCLAKLPDDTIIYPGHDYGPTPTSTIGEQKKTNPYLSAAMQGKDLFFERRGV